MKITTMKKYFENPVLRIVEVKNDIIATSNIYNEEGDGVQMTPGRFGWDDEDEF